MGRWGGAGPADHGGAGASPESDGEKSSDGLSPGVTTVSTRL